MRNSVSEKKVWLITGAGRDLGADIARAALTAGHAVVATGRDGTKVAAAVGDHDNVLAIKLDMTRPQDAEATTRVISSPASSRNSARNRSAIRSRRSCSVR